MAGLLPTGSERTCCKRWEQMQNEPRKIPSDTMRYRMNRIFSQKRTLRFVAIVLLLSLSVLLVDYFCYPYGASPVVPSGNTAENGLWIRYTYYFGEKTDSEIHQLAQLLRQQQMRYAYFHVRFIGNSGKLRFRYSDTATHLLKIIHRDAPGVRSIAWIYVGNKRGMTNVDIHNPIVRRQMV